MDAPGLEHRDHRARCHAMTQGHAQDLVPTVDTPNTATMWSAMGKRLAASAREAGQPHRSSYPIRTFDAANHETHERPPDPGAS
jgi:hypothetical protein